MLQTVFVRLLSGTEHDEAARRPAAYFRRAAVNAAVDLLRRRAVRAETAYDDTAPHAAVESALLLKEQLRRAIATLDSEDATLFVLRYVEGLSNQELADDVPAREEQRRRPAPPNPAAAAGGDGTLSGMSEGDRRCQKIDSTRALRGNEAGDRRCGDARRRARPRLGHGDERRRLPAVRSSGRTSART